MSWRLPNVAWDQNLLCECAGLTKGGAKSYPAMHATECVQHAHVRERIDRLSISRRPRARGAPELELEPLLVRTMMIMYTFFVFVDMHNQLCGIDVILCTVSAGAIALVLVLTRPATAAAAVCMHM